MFRDKFIVVAGRNSYAGLREKVENVVVVGVVLELSYDGLFHFTESAEDVGVFNRRLTRRIAVICFKKGLCSFLSFFDVYRGESGDEYAR